MTAPGSPRRGLTSARLTRWLPHLCSAAQPHPASCEPVDHSPPGSSLHGVLQPRTLEWGARPPPGHLPDAGIEPVSPASAVGFFTRAPAGHRPSSPPLVSACTASGPITALPTPARATFHAWDVPTHASFRCRASRQTNLQKSLPSNPAGRLVSLGSVAPSSHRLDESSSQRTARLPPTLGKNSSGPVINTLSTVLVWGAPSICAQYRPNECNQSINQSIRSIKQVCAESLLRLMFANRLLISLHCNITPPPPTHTYIHTHFKAKNKWKLRG